MSRFAGQSKFFGGGDDSSSEEQSQSSDEENEADQAAVQRNKVSKYMMDSDAEEDEEQRQMKSAKTKKVEALDKIVNDLRKYANIGDFNALDNSFGQLETEIAKSASALFEENGDKLPVSVLKMLILVEDTVNEVTNA